MVVYGLSGIILKNRNVSDGKFLPMGYLVNCKNIWVSFISANDLEARSHLHIPTFTFLSTASISLLLVVKSSAFVHGYTTRTPVV